MASPFLHHVLRKSNVSFSNRLLWCVATAGGASWSSSGARSWLHEALEVWRLCWHPAGESSCALCHLHQSSSSFNLCLAALMLFHNVLCFKQYFFTYKNNQGHCIKTFKYTYMFLSNSVEFSVILQCTMTQYHICCMLSRLSCEFRPWEPETKKDLLPHQASAAQMICSPGYCIWPWPMRPHQQRTQQCKIIVRLLQPSSSLFCATQGVVSSQPLSPICPSWPSDLRMYTYTIFFSPAFTYPAMHVVPG